MNKRQAKIEALSLACGILQGAEMTGLALDFSEQNQKRVEVEFRKIVDRLITRTLRLEANS